MNQPLRVLAAVVVASFALGGCQKYDQLIDLDSLCDQRWADLGANLQRRSDLIPNIVATVKGSAKHEEDTLKAVTEARAAATSIRLSSEDLQDPAKVAAFQKAQDGLHSALSRLLVSNEAYPDLKASAAYHDLMVELEGTENRILRAREQYNDAARQYNAELNKIHGAIVKRATGSTFLPRIYFTVSEQATVAPKVTF